MERCIAVGLVSEKPEVSDVGLASGEKGILCVIEIPRMLPGLQADVSSGSWALCGGEGGRSTG
jgi:hypothetical protein